MKMQIGVDDAITFAAEQAYWDGYAAGAKAASEHAKEAVLRRLTNRPAPPPKQPQPEQTEA
jgi:hypothetical protein